MKGKFLIYSATAGFSLAGCTYFVCQQFNIPYAQIIAFCTFSFAFFTYTLDHYFDARKAQNIQNLHARHLVEVKEYRFALKGLALSILISGYLFYFLPRFYLIIGIIIGLFSVIYFLLIFKYQLNKTLKQLLSAAILSLVIGAWAYVSAGYISFFYLIIIGLAVYSNMRFFGYIDSEYDQKLSGQCAVAKPQNKTFLVLFYISAVVVIFLLGFYLNKGQTWLFIPLTYALFLGIKPAYFKKDLPRLSLDLIMLLPLLRWFW